MIAKVLFPVDFSPAAMAPYVKRAADLFHARVTMVHVCDLASHNGFELCVRAPQEIAEEHLGIAQERLRAFLNTEFPAVKGFCAAATRRRRSPRSPEAAPSISSSARRDEAQKGRDIESEK